MEQVTLCFWITRAFLQKQTNKTTKVLLILTFKCSVNIVTFRNIVILPTVMIFFTKTQH